MACTLSIRDGAPAANTIEKGQRGDGAATQKAGRHAKNQRRVLLVKSVNYADRLQNAEAAKRDERDAFIALLAPDRQHLGDEE